MLSVRTTIHCTLCAPAKYVASRVANNLNLQYQEIQPEPAFNHAVPVVALGDQILFAPTPTQLDISESVLKAAVQHATKYTIAA